MRLSEARARAELREEVTREDAEVGRAAQRRDQTQGEASAAGHRAQAVAASYCHAANICRRSLCWLDFICSTRFVLSPLPASRSQDVVELMKQTIDSQVANAGGDLGMLDFTARDGGRAGSKAAESRRLREGLVRHCQVRWRQGWWCRMRAQDGVEKSKADTRSAYEVPAALPACCPSCCSRVDLFD